MDCDLVVVGSGAGALAGAYTAAAAGLSVVVLEKTAFFGGTSAYSGAGLFLPGNQAETRAGVTDSVDRGRTYLRALFGQLDERHEAFLATAPELVEFLERDPAIEFRYFSFPDYYAVDGRLPGGGHIVPVALPSSSLGPDLLARLRPTIAAERHGVVVPRDTLGGGQALIGRLLLALTATGRAALRTGVCVDRLLMDGGTVVGVAAGAEEFRAGGVLLACGGFEGNGALRTDFGVPGDASWTMGPRGTNAGEPLRAAMAIGAATALTDEAWWCPGLVQPDGSAAFFLGLRGGIFVDGAGERFANESLPYDRMGRALASGPGTCSFIFDSREGGNVPAINCVPGATREQYLGSGAWVRADTVAELAVRIGLPPQALQASIERFNGYAKTGVDEQFHRGEDEYDRYFAAPADAPNPCLLPLDRAPFYAARVVLGDLGTKGGLRTDADGRVLGVAGNVIEGLYAAGNTSASIMGRYYPAPGSPIGTAMVFAYRAARHVATSR